MRAQKGFTLIELLVVIAIIAILAAILFPVFAKARDAARTSTCLSNMNQIGKAMKSYMTDWEDTFPSNREYNVPGAPQSNLKSNLAVDVPLTTYDPSTNNRFQYGLTWVEALFPYIERVGDPSDNASVWKCPCAQDGTYADDGTAGTGTGSDKRATASNTYAMNYNLLELQESALKVPGNTMLIREMDRKFGSVTRAIPDTGGTGEPLMAFLAKDPTGNYEDPDTPNPSNKIHQVGSNILFADAHTKNLSTDLMPVRCVLSTKNGTPTTQWWNFNPETNPLQGIVAVTP